VVAAALRSNDAVVTLDTDVTPELEAEGLARDVVREIQNARKAEDLVVTDRIDLWIDAASDTVAAAIGTHEAYIAEQVLGTSITMGAGPDEVSAHEATVGGEPLRFSLKVS
jgi:isoleucyl-tRNA synthetase